MGNHRVTCPRCAKPSKTCLCKFMAQPLANRVELLILQHPTEARNAKNSVTLMLLGLKNHRICIGESFDASKLHEQLYANSKQPLLLYPSTPDEKSLGLLTPTPLPNLDQLSPETIRLIVLDATWRKSRKMLYLNQALQQLPRFQLVNPPTTIYKIRKADSENQLSTLEASCYALQQLEPGSDYGALLEAFRRFVDQFASFLPNRNP